MGSKSRRCTVGPSTAGQSTVGPRTVEPSTGMPSTGSAGTVRRRGIRNPGSTVGWVRNCTADTVGRRLKKT